MRLNFVSVLMFSLLVVILISGCIERGQFKTFTSEEGGFSILMPGTPAKEIVNIDTEVGIIPVHSFKSINEHILYSISYSDYPDWYFEEEDATEFLESVIDAKIKAVFGELQSSIIISIDGYPGMEFRYTVNQDDEVISGRSRIYLVSNRLYDLRTFSPKDKAFTGTIDAFFKSFTLTKIRPELGTSKEEAPEDNFPYATLWIDEDRTVNWTAVENDNGESLQLIVTYNGNVVLGWNARGETQYKYFREEPGTYAFYLEQFIDGQYRVISNIVSYQIP